jgi:uncharacterized protein (TIGR03435 family)
VTEPYTLNMMRYILAGAMAGLLAAQAPPEFEVASIRPSSEQPTPQVQAGLQITQAQIRVARLTLRDYIGMAYRMQSYQISGPDWLSSTRFDVTAKLPDGAAPTQIPEMLQTLLGKRFELRAHREEKEVPVYALEVTPSGPKLQKSAIDPATDGAPQRSLTVTGSGSSEGIGVDLGQGAGYSFANNRFEGRKLTMTVLARTLTTYVGRPVVDRTKIDGPFDVVLDVTPEDYQAMLIRAAVSQGVSLPSQALRLLDTASIDSLSDALARVGLALVSRRAPIEVLVVDSIQRTPTEN